MLICQLIRKHAWVARSGLYKKQYPFSLYIFRVCLLYASSYKAIIQYSSRLKLLNRGRITLQFKYPQLYYTIVNPFITYLVTYRCLPFMSGASQPGLLQLGFSARMGLWPYWCFLTGILRSVLLLVGLMVLLLGQKPQISSIRQLFTCLYLPCLSPSPYRRFPVAQL